MIDILMVFMKDFFCVCVLHVDNQTSIVKFLWHVCYQAQLVKFDMWIRKKGL